MPLSWIEINLNALRHNYHEARKRLQPHTKLMAIVKSDAYGHGMVPVALELQKIGTDFFGVSKFWEAVELRRAQITRPILVLLGIEEEDIEEAVRLDIRAALYRIDHAKRLSAAAKRLETPAKVHVKVDTGMGRLGVPFAEFNAFLDDLVRLPGIEIEGLLSHFAVADEADKSYSEWQLKRFQTCLETVSAKGLQIPYAHVSNSAGLLDLPHGHYQLVRPGLMLYGSPPSQEILRPADLKQVMTFKSRIIQFKNVPAGHSIGYGRTYMTQRPSWIATIPVGYDDGYPRLLSNRSQVLIRGKRAPVVGRVSMNMITADVTDIPGAREDEEVVLLGSQGEERISAEELAFLCDTINYEIYCSLGHHRFKYFVNAP